MCKATAAENWSVSSSRWCVIVVRTDRTQCRIEVTGVAVLVVPSAYGKAGRRQEDVDAPFGIRADKIVRFIGRKVFVAERGAIEPPPA